MKTEIPEPDNIIEFPAGERRADESHPSLGAERRRRPPPLPRIPADAALEALPATVLLIGLLIYLILSLAR